MHFCTVYAEVKDKQKADEGDESQPEVPQKQLSEDLNEEIPSVPQQNLTIQKIFNKWIRQPRKECIIAV